MKAKFSVDFFLGVCGTVFGAAFLYQSGTLMYPSKVFPIFIAIAIIIVSVLIAIQGLMTSPRHSKTSGIFSGLGKPVIVVFIATAYIVSISHIGFYVASFLCIMVLSLVATRDLPTLASVGATAVAASVYLGVVYLIFSYLLGSSIPS